jgi:hypothetical protein
VTVGTGEDPISIARADIASALEFEQAVCTVARGHRQGAMWD